jgi:Mg2+ and Co2+ transporter CorA
VTACAAFGAWMRRLMPRKGGELMDVRLVCDGGLERHEIEELPRLLERRDAVIWVDIPSCDQQAADVLSGVFGFHPIAVRDCVERNHVSKVHIYPDYVFSVRTEDWQARPSTMSSLTSSSARTTS